MPRGTVIMLDYLTLEQNLRPFFIDKQNVPDFAI